MLVASICTPQLRSSTWVAICPSLHPPASQPSANPKILKTMKGIFLAKSPSLTLRYPSHLQVLVVKVQQNFVPALVLGLDPLVFQVASAKRHQPPTHSLNHARSQKGKREQLTSQPSTHAPDRQRSRYGSSPSGPPRTSSRLQGPRPWKPACRGGL